MLGAVGTPSLPKTQASFLQARSIQFGTKDYWRSSKPFVTSLMSPNTFSTDLKGDILIDYYLPVSMAEVESATP